jgi:hypothetical protein
MLLLLLFALAISTTEAYSIVRTAAGNGNTNVASPTDLVGCDTSGSNMVTVTLPLVSTHPTYAVRVCDEAMNAGNNPITILLQAGDTLQHTHTSITISYDGTCLFLYNDGVSNWVTSF